MLGSLLVSALVHGVASVPLKSALEDLQIGRSVPSKPVEVVPLAASTFESSLARARSVLREIKRRKAAGLEEKEPPSPPKTKKEKPEEKLNGQVVEIPASNDKRPSKNARFLAKENSRVERETVARMDRRDPNRSRVTHRLQKAAPRQRTDDGPAGTAPPVKRGDGKAKGKKKAQKKKRSRDQSDGQFGLEIPKLERRDGVELDLNVPSLTKDRLWNRSGQDAMPGNGRQFRLGRGEASERAGDGGESKRTGLPTLQQLMPAFGTTARLSGSPSDDYVENVPEGEGTFLNAREFKYATFFYQVKDTVGQHWRPSIRKEIRRRDPTGDVLGFNNHTTMVFVRLDPSGRLNEVRVAESSGHAFLDELAIRAFEKAESFPNPPRGIVDNQGHITFHFGFTITNARRGPLGLF